MAEITKKNLVLGFSTTAGKSVNLTIKEPAESLTSAMISEAMDEIIASGALGEEGVVTTKEDAKYVIQEVDTITL